MRNPLLFIILLVLVGFTSCETEVDITAEYERLPVVFGLLDVEEEEQYILINRTFLGNGNALDMAQIQDSMLYDNVEAYIRWNPYGGNSTADIVDGMAQVQLEETVAPNGKFDGLFFTEAPVAYSTDFDFIGEIESVGSTNRPDFLENTVFELFALADGDTIRAETRLSEGRGSFGRIVFSVPFEDGQDIDFVQNFNLDASNYLASGIFIQWNDSGIDQVFNGVKQSVTLEFDYTETYLDNTSAVKTVEVPIITLDAQNPNTIDEFEQRLDGAFFYRSIANRIQPSGNVKYRAIGGIRYRLDVAAEDLTTYLNIGDPISEVGQQRPTYSNVNDGEGLGIFSSRTSVYRNVVLYDQGLENDLQEMVLGQFTGGLCFCDPTPGSTFDCNNPANQCQ